MGKRRRKVLLTFGLQFFLPHLLHQAVRHNVKTFRQFPHFVGPVILRTPGQVSRRDPFGHPAQFADGLGQVTGQHPGTDRRHRQKYQQHHPVLADGVRPGIINSLDIAADQQVVCLFPHPAAAHAYQLVTMASLTDLPDIVIILRPAAESNHLVHIHHGGQLPQFMLPAVTGSLAVQHNAVASGSVHIDGHAFDGFLQGIDFPVFLAGLITHFQKILEHADLLAGLLPLLLQHLSETEVQHPHAEGDERRRDQYHDP